MLGTSRTKLRPQHQRQPKSPACSGAPFASVGSYKKLPAADFAFGRAGMRFHLSNGFKRDWAQLF